MARQLSYDEAGRIRTELRGTGTTGRRFSYDSLGRLLGDSTIQRTSTPLPPGCVDPDYGRRCSGGSLYYQATAGQAFSYDPVGNRTDQGAAYQGSTNRLTSFGGCTYTNDFDGNVLTRSGCVALAATFTWRAENRLATIVAGGQSIALHYDAFDRRVRKDIRRTCAQAGGSGRPPLRGHGKRGNAGRPPQAASVALRKSCQRRTAFLMISAGVFVQTNGLGSALRWSRYCSMCRTRACTERNEPRRPALRARPAVPDHL